MTPPVARSQLHTAAIMPAAGSGRRFGGDENKLFALIDGKPLWYHAASRLRQVATIGPIIMPVSADDRVRFESDFSEWVRETQVTLVQGGAERTDSVRAGLDAICSSPHYADVSLIAVHDAARPLVLPADVESVIRKAAEVGAAILANRVPATVKRDLGADDQIQTIDRNDLWLAQTPQVFQKERLIEAYEKYRGRPATDDAELVERLGHPVALVPGSADNLKITHPDDLPLAESILQRQLFQNCVNDAD